MFGYFSNAVKTSLVVILKFIEEASKIFEGTGIELTTEGQTLLGSAVGTVSFVREDVTDKVMEWVEDISMLTKIAELYPHSACAAFTHGIMGT